MAAHYAHKLLSFRWPILILWSFLLFSSAAIYLARFNIDNSVGIWFLENDPDLQRYRAFQRDFGTSEWVFAVVQTRSIRDLGFLTRLHGAAAEIEALPDVAHIFTVVIPTAALADARSAGAFTLPYTNLAASAEDPRAAAALRDLLIHPGDVWHTGILIETTGQARAGDTQWAPTIKAIRAIFATRLPLAEHWLAGTPVINAELNGAARRDMLVFYCVLSLLLVAFGRLFLGQTRDLAVLLAVVLGSVLPPLGLVGAIGLSFNMVTIMLPTILVSMSASIAVHMINEFHRARETMPGEAATSLAVTAVVRPAFWTSATTVAGFLTLVQSDVDPIRQVGYLAALGIMLGFVNTFVVAPLLLEMLWKAPGDTGRARLPGRIAGLAAAVRHPRTAIACSALLFAGCLSGLPRLEADTDYVNFFRNGRQINADYRHIAEAGFAQFSLDLDLRLPEGHRIWDADYGSAIQRLRRDLAALPGVYKVLADAYSSEQLFNELATAPETIAFREAARTDPAEDGPLRLTTPDGQRTRLVIFSDHMSSRALSGFRATVAGLVQRDLPDGIDARVVGTNVLWSNMDTSVVKTQRASIAIIFCGLLVLMPLLAGSLRAGLIGLAVSVLPVLSVLGLMGWTGLTVNVATCLIGGVALGVAIDDTIFLLLRTRRETANGADLRLAIRKSLWIAGRAMVTTSAIMAICFLSMGLSDFMPTAQFGWLFALTILAALTADLLLLPALLLLFGWRRAR